MTSFDTARHAAARDVADATPRQSLAAAGAHGIARRALEAAAVALLLLSACFVFFWNLSSSGYANEFYSAAAQAGSVSWEAFLWGGLDAGGAITVDKPPASIWLMALSVRLFGLSSFSILLPQAIMGVATTLIVFLIARRVWGTWFGVLAGALFVTTPVAALMFRFNNPDALLVLLMTLAADCVLRALEKPASRGGNRARTALLALAGGLVGLGFLTKQFQVLLVVPGFVLALFAFSPAPWRRKLLDAAVSIGSILLASGWWVALTVLVPSGSRPFIGGSQTDSFLELTFGYNGLGRLTGDETGSVVPGGGGGQGGMWGETGIERLLGSDFADQFSWFALFALAGIVLVVIAARISRARSTRSARGDAFSAPGARGTAARHASVSDVDIVPCPADPLGPDALARLRSATAAVFGCWLVITWLAFSFMAGIFHQYYTVALTPAVAVLAAGCIHALYTLRHRLWAQLAALVLAALSTTWAYVLIARSDSFTGLAIAILIAGLAGCMLGDSCLLFRLPRAGAAPRAERVAAGASVFLVASALCLGPALWTGCTIAIGHSGSIVTAGPNGSGGPGGGMGGMGGMGGQGAPGGGAGCGGADDDAAGEGAEVDAGGGAGSLLGGGMTSELVAELLIQNAQGYRWAAATTGSQNAAGYQLATELPVMAIGGFNGTDPAPTLEQFQEYVERGLVRYYIAGGEMGGRQMGGSNTASQIESWVEENFEAQTVGNVTIYDLAS